MLGAADQPGGVASGEVLKRAIFEKDVRVEYETLDRYNRYLGTIFLGTNNVNLAIVRKGWAWAYHFCQDAEFRTAMEKAKAEKRGIWKEGDPIDPYDWRGGRRMKTGFDANTNTNSTSALGSTEERGTAIPD